MRKQKSSYRGYREKTILEELIIISIGTLLLAIGIANIYDPFQMVTGGVGGIAIILRAVLNIPLWVSNTVINIPLFIVGYYLKGWKFLAKTMYSTILLTVFLMVLPSHALIPTADYFLAAIFGGILSGIGCGLIFGNNATSGGTDLFAAIVQKYLPHYSLTQILQVVDWIIVLAGIHFFGLECALYAVVSIYVMSHISSAILDGMNFAKTAFIISPQTKEIADAILNKMGRGVTGIKATGMFSENETLMLYCVLSNREVPSLKDLVRQIDPTAFMIVADAREVSGEGFTYQKINKEKILS